MSVNIGPKIGIDGEREYRKQVNNLITQAKTFSSEMREMESSFDKNTSAMERNRKKSELLEKQIKNQKDVVDELEKGLDASREKYGDNATQTQKWEQAVNNAKTELNRLNRELENTPNRLQTVGTKMQSVGKGMQTVGGGLTKYVSVPLAAIGAASIKMAADAETSFAKVRTLIGDSEMSYEQLTSSVMKASNETGVAVTDFNEALYSSVSAGIDSGKAIEFTTDAVKLAKGGFTSTEKAVDVMTTVLNAYGMSAEEATSVSDMLITTQNEGKTTVDQLAGSLGKVIPTARSTNVKFSALSAGMAVLTKRGISTNEATTYLNAMLSELGKSGSTTDKILREKTGKSFSQLMDAGVPLTEVLQILDQAAKDDGKSLSDLFSKQSAGKAALTIMSDAGAEFNSVLDKMEHSSGATAAAFGEMSNTAQAKFNKAVNEAKNVGIELGQELMKIAVPALKSLGDVVHSASEWFSGLSDSQKDMVVKAGLIATGLGPAVSAIGKVVEIAGAAVSAIGAIPGAFGMLTGVAAPVGVALGAMALAKAGMDGMREDAINAVDGLRDSMGQTAEKTKALNKSVSSVRDTIKETNESVAQINQKSATADKLIDELYKLENQSKKTKEEQSRMKQIVAALNSLYPELGLSIDGATGKLNKGKTEVKNYVEQAKKLALVEAYTIGIQNAYNDLANAQIALKDAQDAQKEALNTYATAFHDYRMALEEAGISEEDLRTGMIQLCPELQNMANGVDLARGNLETCNKAVKDGETAVDEATETTTEWEATLAELSDTTEGSTESTEEFSASEQEAAESTEELTEQVSTLDKVHSAFRDGMHKLAEVVDGAYSSASESARAAASEHNKTAQAASDSVQKQIGLFDKLEEKEKVSISTLKENAAARREAIQNYSKNMDELIKWAEESGSESAKMYVQAIAEMGIGAASEVETLANASKEDLEYLANENYEAVVTADFYGERAAYVANGFRTKEQLVWEGWSSGIGKYFGEKLGDNKMFRKFTRNVKDTLTGTKKDFKSAKIEGSVKGIDVPDSVTGKAKQKAENPFKKMEGKLSAINGAEAAGAKAKGEAEKPLSTLSGKLGKIEGAEAAGRSAASEASRNVVVTGRVTSITGTAEAGKKASTEISNNTKVSGTIKEVRGTAEAGKKAGKEISDNADSKSTVKVWNGESAGRQGKKDIERGLGTIYVNVAAKVTQASAIIAALAAGHAEGGFITTPHLGLVGEAGPEVIIPLSASRRSRALDLFEQTAEILGTQTASIPTAPTAMLPTRSLQTETFTTHSFGLDLSALYDTVAAAACAGMQSANIRVYWDNREAGRIMRDMGVQFA